MTTMMKSHVGRFPSCRCIHKWLLVMATLRYLPGTYCRGFTVHVSELASDYCVVASASPHHDGTTAFLVGRVH